MNPKNPKQAGRHVSIGKLTTSLCRVLNPVPISETKLSTKEKFGNYGALMRESAPRKCCHCSGDCCSGAAVSARGPNSSPHAVRCDRMRIAPMRVLRDFVSTLQICLGKGISKLLIRVVAVRRFRQRASGLKSRSMDLSSSVIPRGNSDRSDAIRARTPDMFSIHQTLLNRTGLPLQAQLLPLGITSFLT